MNRAHKDVEHLFTLLQKLAKDTDFAKVSVRQIDEKIVFEQGKTQILFQDFEPLFKNLSTYSVNDYQEALKAF